MKKNSKISYTERQCYVCGKTIEHGAGKYIGKDLYRHTNCYIGSDKWLKSKYSKDSKIKQYYIQKEK